MITEDHSHEMLHVRHSHVHRHREQAFIGAKVGECGWTEGYLDVVIAEHLFLVALKEILPMLGIVQYDTAGIAFVSIDDEGRVDSRREESSQLDGSTMIRGIDERMGLIARTLIHDIIVEEMHDSHTENACDSDLYGAYCTSWPWRV